METWLTDLQHLLARGDAAVLVTVAHVDGSAPRDAGTKMLVTRDAARHTIGGGHLEWKAIEIARQLLKEGAHTPHARRLERLALGPSLGQCCGGAVVLAFERLDIADLGWVTSLAKRAAAGAPTVRSVSFGADADTMMLSEPEPGATRPDCLLWDIGGAPLLTETIAPRAFSVVLFGAGHVGAALVRVLGTLPCHVRWVDERDAQFPPPDTLAGIRNLSLDANDAPDEAIDEAQPGAYFVVMTHNHARDLELAHRILSRGDYAYFGMIGSRTKRMQFEHRLAARGIDPRQIARMQCPIGVPGIVDKAPEAIAIAVSAQILQTVDARRANGHPAASPAAHGAGAS
ncbi:xanthine dehydrogenase accessory protein XdhC [Burkholderia thailandensis E264]|uniref:Xanthine dehydrogenase accessory protein XdhC, putative n=1 Tax=Burkholderia thailandensis (strain ATCC 700388 / DSM 13276 / CCUG 48851 / CIP 106301 / E264) TaxID=271848 RepID=Q2SY48_BURTA|nr:xanthine dehydrogenase accessory protein XdhC [Burkholderia thailandensis]ABC38016.1 xanthine dehydrogenase accessory protein XdhC, putative [Burkholderia thailandensis E264]AHI74835.1 xanthine dehydrogenase accessory protein XdhC [Burkholderia thailandensis 2002721723]AIP24439.1 xanthine dehydrogenase accessory protein XdhC [Burkholderia thailandensis E264]AJX99624.1 xanthine dehydrogenase accessory protein XdhC [Burkholderia thailandensis 2002721643]MUV27639.1 xanthine dehydrogenase acces